MVEKLNRSMTATNKTSQLLDTARELNNTANAVRLQRLKGIIPSYNVARLIFIIHRSIGRVS